MGVEHLRPWKKGQSGNPGGRPKLPDHLRLIKELTAEESRRLFAKYLRMSRTELDTALADPAIPMIDLAIAKQVLFAVGSSADFALLSFLLDRTIGKVRDVPPPTEEDEAIRDLERLSDAELLHLVKEKLPELEARNEPQA